MKKKVLLVLLVTIMSAGVFTGCGNSVEGDKVQAAMAESGNAQTENSDVPEDGEEGTVTVEPTAEQTPEATDEPEPEATTEPTEEPSTEATAEPDSEETDTTEPEEAAEGSGTSSNPTTSAKTVEVGDFKITTMKETTMYAKSQVNVRSLPNTTGEKLGKLTANQEVVVTGKCEETGWYQIQYNKGIAYVSDSYLVSEKPSTGSNNTGNTGSSKTGNNATNTSKTPDTAAKTDDTTQTQQSSTSSGTSSAFIDYLNQQRAAAGLSQLSWDSNLAAECEKRAKEISTDYRHTDMMGGTASECIQANNSSSVSEWYTTWYNSEGHRLALMDSTMSTGACGFFQVNGVYYVVFLGSGFQIDAPTQEEIQEKVESGEMHQMESIDNGDAWDSYGTEGVSTEAPEGEDWSWVDDFNWG